MLRQAIYAFEKANQTYPETLEQLVPDYLGSSDYFICPEAKKVGDTTSGSVQVQDYSGAGTSYEYQLTLRPRGVTDLAGESQETTIRAFKLNQFKALGDEVPCIRCFHHGPDAVRNLSIGGSIYESGSHWESLFVERIALPYLMDGVITDQRPIRNRLQERDPELPAASLDLSGSYNALLTDRWLGGARQIKRGPFEPGVLEFDGIRFDVRGVLQLQGKGMPLVKFPSSRIIKNVPSGQRVYVLQGSFFEGAAGEKVAGYRLHFLVGEPVEVPVRFGEQIWHSEIPNQAELPEELTAHAHGSPTFTVYHFSFDVPEGRDVRSIEFRTGESEAAPFLLGVTIE